MTDDEAAVEIREALVAVAEQLEGLNVIAERVDARNATATHIATAVVYDAPGRRGACLMDDPSVAVLLAAQGTDFPTWFRQVRRATRSARTRLRTAYGATQGQLLHSPPPEAAAAEETRAIYERSLGALDRTAELIDYFDAEFRADPTYVPPLPAFRELLERYAALAALLPRLQREIDGEHPA